MTDPPEDSVEAPRPRSPWELPMLFAAVAAWVGLWYVINSLPNPGQRAHSPQIPLDAQTMMIGIAGIAVLASPFVVLGLALWVRLIREPNRLEPLRSSTALLLYGALAAMLISQVPAMAIGLGRGHRGLRTLWAFVIASAIGAGMAYLWARFALRARGDTLGGLGWSARSSAGRAVRGYLAMIPLLAASLAATLLLLVAFPNAPNATNPAAEWAMRATRAQFPLLIILACVIAPMLEEMVFRGLVFRGLEKRYGVFVGALASAMIFAGMHPQMPFGFPPLVAFAFALCYVYRASGSLVPCILIHGASNALVLTLARLGSGYR